MKNLSLGAKICIVVGVLVSINMLSVVIGLRVSSWTEDQYQTVVNFTDDLTISLHAKEDIAFLRGEIMRASRSDPSGLKEIQTQSERLGQKVNADVKKIFGGGKGCPKCHSPAEMKVMETKALDSLEQFLRVGQEIIQFQQADPGKAASLVSTDLQGKYGTLQALLEQGIEKGGNFVGNTKTKVAETYGGIRQILFALAFLGLVVAIIAGVAYSHKVVAPLRNVSSHFEHIASNVLAVAKDQSENTTKQASAIVQVSASAEELSRAAEALTKQAEVIAQVANKSMQKAIEVTERTQSTVSFINTVKDHSDEASRKIMSLGETIDEIGKVLALIEDVASQTRLLAFNASIEAVSAGEAGRRFSIVAKHIKDLAENTSASTEEIKKLIEEIRLLAHTTVLSTEQMQKAVNEGVAQVSMAGQAIEKIKEVIQENHEVAQKINIATSQQGSATEQITDTMEELSNSAQALAEGSKQTVSAMKELNHSASTLRKMIEG